jgi:hypothetical protein
MPRRNKRVAHEPYETSRFTCDKRRFKSEGEALKAAELQMLEKMMLELSVYKCDICGQWHLTRKTG